MKKTAGLIAVASTAAVLLAGTGLAQTPKAPPAPAQQPSPAPKMPAGSEKAAPSSPMSDRHTMEGEVTKVDAKKGWVDVKTAEGRLKLHYPPPALDSVKKGDRVTVEIGLSAAK